MVPLTYGRDRGMKYPAVATRGMQADERKIRITCSGEPIKRQNDASGDPSQRCVGLFAMVRNPSSETIEMSDDAPGAPPRRCGAPFAIAPYYPFRGKYYFPVLQRNRRRPRPQRGQGWRKGGDHEVKDFLRAENLRILIHIPLRQIWRPDEQ